MSDGTGRCEAHRRLHTNRFGDKDRGSRHERGYGTAWGKLRAYVLNRDKGLCQPCLRDGRVTAGREVDHIVNKQRGGTDDSSNLQCICRDCHRAKTATEARAGWLPRPG